MEKDPKSDANDFTWPPPPDELDALEPLFITDDSDSRPKTEVAPAPRVDSESTQLARRRRAAERRQSAIRLIVTVLPWVGAIAIGAMLGERQARINRTEFVAHEETASSERAAPTAPPVTRAVPSLTRETPAVAPSATLQASPIRQRDSPVSATTPASRSRSTREASSVIHEPITTSTVTAAPVSPAAAQPDEIAPTPTPAPAPTAIDARPSASEAAPVTAPDAALGAATPVPSVAAPAAPAAAAVPATIAAIPRRLTTSDHAAIRRALQTYEDAYDHLDAHAAAAVWPSLDVPALTRAFEGLKAQRLQFDRCDLTVGFGSATAVCAGAAHIVRRIGRPDPLVERRSWTFHLKRAGSDAGAEWKIESVNTSR